MYQGLLGALAALVVAVCSHAYANGGPGAAVGLVDRHLTVASFTAAEVDSFLKRQVQHDPFSDDTTSQSLWGIAARSAVPVVGSKARLDYSVFVPDDHNGAIADLEHQLMQFSVQDGYRFVDFGGSLFTAGDAFLSHPLAHQRLMAAGVPGPGAGREVWARARLPLLGLRPSFRHVDIANELAEDTRSASTTTLALSSPIPNGNLFLRNVHVQEQTPGTAFGISRWRWEAGGFVRTFGATLSPVLARERQFNDGEEAWASSRAGFNLHTRLVDATVLNLQLHHDRREARFEPRRSSLSANLAVTTPLRPWPRTPPGLSLTAALGYLDHHGLPLAQPNEGMSVRLSLNFQGGG